LLDKISVREGISVNETIFARSLNQVSSGLNIVPHRPTFHELHKFGFYHNIRCL